MKRLALLGLLLGFLLPAPLALAKSRATRSVQNDWHAPQCVLTGLPWLRFAEPDGKVHGGAVDPSWTDRNVPTLVALAAGAPNTLWAVDSAGAILRSDDAGCSWGIAAAVPESLAGQFDVGIAARHASRVYVYTASRYPQSTRVIVRLTGATVETFAIPDSQGFAGMDVDPEDALHLRAIGASGNTWESVNGGASWKIMGSLGFLVPNVRAVAFDPSNFQRILVGSKTDGLSESRDGGRSWRSLPVGANDVEGVRIAPSDPTVIYAGTVPSKLMRSTDGGKTFAVIDVAVRGPYARLYYMGTLFAVHPHRATTFASEGDYRIGVKVTTATGVFVTSAVENVATAVWAPNGYLYYTQLVIEPL